MSNFRIALVGRLNRQVISHLGHLYRAGLHSLWTLMPGVMLLLLSSNLISIPSPYLATLVSFCLVLIMPGSILLDIVSRDRMPIVEKMAISFVLSVGMWSIPAALLLQVGSNLKMMANVVIWVSLGLGGLSSLRSLKEVAVKDKDNANLVNKAAESPTDANSRHWLVNTVLAVLFWLCLLLLVVTFVSFITIRQPSDRVTYAGIIRYYLDTDYFGRTGILSPGEISPRGFLTVWLVQLAVVNKMASVDLSDMYSFYIPALLIVVSYFAVYSLARNVFKSHVMAVSACLIQTFFYFCDISDASVARDYSSTWIRLQHRGGVGLSGNMIFSGSIIEDKLLLVLIVLPIAQIYLLKYITWGKLRHAIILAVVLSAVVLVHPMGIVLFGLPFGVFAFVNFAVQPGRKKLVRASIVAVFLLIGAIVPIYLSLNLASSVDAEAVWNPALEQASYFLLSVISAKYNLYMLDPSLLARGTLLVLALLALPVLAKIYGWRKPGIQIILSMMLTPLIFAFNPVVAPVLAKVISFRMLRRVYWIMVIPVGMILAAALITTVDLLIQRFFRNRRLLKWVPLSPVAFVLFMSIVLRPDVAAGIQLLRDREERGVLAKEVNVLRHLRERVVPGSVMLAPLDSLLSNNIAEMVGYSFAVPRKGTDANEDAWQKNFYRSQFVAASDLEIIESLNVRYIILSKDSSLDLQFDSFCPTFVRIYQDRQFSVYEAVPEENPALVTHIITANELFMAARYQEAIEEYQVALTLDPHNAWACIMMGDIYSIQGDASRSVSMYEQAMSTISSPQIHLKLGDAYRKMGRLEDAQVQYHYLLDQPQYLQLSQVRLAQTAGDTYQAAGAIEQSAAAYRWASLMGTCELPATVPREIYRPSGWPAIGESQLLQPQVWLSECLSNDMIVTSTPVVATTYDFLENLDRAHRESNPGALVRKGVFTIPGDPGAVLFQHPSSRIDYPVHLLRDSRLTFSFCFVF